MKKRYITLWILSPILAVVMIAGLIISPLGAPVIRYAAQSFVPNLTIADVEGTILSDFSVSGVSWENENWRIEVGQATINIVLGCLMTPKVCIDKLAVDKLAVTQIKPPAEDTTEEETDEPFTMPVDVVVNDITFTSTSVTLPGQQVILGEFTAKASASDTIILQSPLLKNLTVTLAGDDEPAAPASASFVMEYTAPALPTVALPIPVSITEFALYNGKIVQGESTQHIPVARFAELAFKDTQLKAEELHVEHDLATVDASANIDLSGNYPLSLSTRAQIKLNDTQTENIQLDASGSLERLDLQMTAQGAYEAKLSVNANILSDTLPLNVTATWPRQPLPAVENSALFAGSLTLEGIMGQYQLNAESGVNLPEIGDIPFTADATLNRQHITVNEADVSILDGEITSTGTLYLNENLSWSGKTTLKNITTQSLVAGGPADLNGEFTSLMRMTENGPEVSLTGLNIEGKQGEWPLHFEGSLAYSVPSDLLVGTLSLEQEQNRLVVAGQLFKERYLDASIIVDLKDVQTLYPGLSGSITGKIETLGEWQDPQADGTITLADVQVSPTVNEFMSQQGLLNGDIAVNGKLTNHHVTVDLNLPEHKAQLALSGSWQDQRWKGNIESSQLELLTTRWQLEAPFDVAVRPEPFSMKLTEHCWQSRNEGELCMDDLLYKDDQARWLIKANALPIGLWAHELAPTIIPGAPDSTLTITTHGKLGPDTPIQANFTLQVTPAVWKLGNNQQVALNLSEMTATGTFKDDVLKAQAHLTSEEMGSIDVDVQTQSTGDQQPLEGNIQLTDIRLAPLKPVSPAIRDLGGELNGNIGITGSITEPVLQGSVQLQNGAVDIKDMPVSISQWQQDIALNGEKATFDGKFLLGGGEGTLTGNVDWSNELLANLKLKGKQFEVRQRDIRMRLSPNLTVNAAPGNVEVTGKVDIPWARVVIEELPENAVSPSEDVYLRGEPPKQEPLDVVNANIMVNIDKEKAGEVKIEAFGLTANLHGGIQVNSHPSLVAYGDLQILDGRFQAYGQDLIIQTGEVQFNGPLDQPLLLVEAIRDPDKTEDGVVAGIRVDGPADSPNVNLFSEPAMNQSASLAYLLNGRGPGAGSSEPNYNALLLGFGLSNTEKLQGKVGSALGIEDFSVGTTSSPSGGDTKLSLSGRLNDRLTLQYNVDVGLNSNDQTTQNLRRRQEAPDLALRYRLLPKLFVEAVQTTIEEQTEFAVDLYYEFFVGESTPVIKKDRDENDESEAAAQEP
ncbi:DUF490 domain-containing protein [Alteromonas pelagimontana]|uniref:DUF490 domain-containing protein n=1 Tax=Alteromonas pelagimontana TaxID=1858656 RepID=A0A6M4MCQ6_9ALTE|nr:translocation/assembly module TamB domain-containing protein [Alteromonas pelagimontana]QJR80892.1 DUF490 domain-containing protein [Alteromonas pelagimontana]